MPRLASRTLWGHLSPLLPSWATDVSSRATGLLLVLIAFADVVLGIVFFAGLKGWKFSEDGGFVPSLFKEMWQGSGYSDLTLLTCACPSAPAREEAALAHDTDAGPRNVRSTVLRLPLLCALAAAAYTAAVQAAPRRGESRLEGLLRVASSRAVGAADDLSDPLLGPPAEARTSSDVWPGRDGTPRWRLHVQTPPPAARAAPPGRSGLKTKQLLQGVGYAVGAASQLYISCKAVLLQPDDWKAPDELEAAVLYTLVICAHAEVACLHSLTNAAVRRKWADNAEADAVASEGGAEGLAVMLAAALEEGEESPRSGADVAPPLYTDDGPVAPLPPSFLQWSVELMLPYAGRMLLGLLALLLDLGCTLAVPWVMGRALDGLPDAGRFSASSGCTSTANDTDAFRENVKLLGALTALVLVSSGVCGVCLATVTASAQHHVSLRVYAALLRQDVAFFDASSAEELRARLGEDVVAAAEALEVLPSMLLRAVLGGLGGLCLSLVISWRLTLLVGSVLGVGRTLTGAYAGFGQGLRRKRAESAARASASAADAMANLRLARTLSCEWGCVTSYAAESATGRVLGVRDARARAATHVINEWLNLAASVLLLALGGLRVMRPEDTELTLGRLLAFVVYFWRLDAQLRSVRSGLDALVDARAAAERLRAVLKLEPAVGSRGAGAGYGEREVRAILAASAEGALPRPPESSSDVDSPFLAFGALALTLSDVRFTYPTAPAKPILAGFTLHIPPACVAALVGRAGCGKSTLVSLLLRHYAPQVGSIVLGGVPLADLPPPALHAVVALVDAHAPLFATSVWANLTAGAPAERCNEGEVREACRRAGLPPGWLAQLPRGFETLLGEAGVVLPAGERRLLALARALLRRPRVLLLDGASSGLAPEEELAVSAALEGVLASGQATVVLVAHRLATARSAGLIAVMGAGGRVVESGTSEELLRPRGGREGGAGVFAGMVLRQQEAQAAIERSLPQARGGRRGEVERTQEAARLTALAGGELAALLDVPAPPPVPSRRSSTA